MNDQPNTQAKRERLTKLFEFLKAYTDLRYPPVRDINQQPRILWLDDLPAYSTVELFRDAGKADEEDEDSGIALRLTRPATTPCPPPPAALSEWLKLGWREYRGTVEIEPTCNVVKDGKTLIERFEDNYQRPVLLRDWQRQREQWVKNETPARQTLALFQTVYEWYGILEREGEKIELMVGDGLLCCPDAAGKFRHPVLLQKLELEFYPENKPPQFVFRKREQPPKLYKEFLLALPEVNIPQIKKCEGELEKTEFAPLGEDDTDGFLLRLIQGLFPTRGALRESTDQLDLESQVDSPTIERQPVIFMRQRRTGPSSIFDAILQDIASRIDFSPALLQILGLAEGVSNQTESIAGSHSFGNEDEDVLLSKPANREQLDIARQLARRDCVLVQGPPGTGKTHTIANLLGHLLAQGKRVLVTAHTPKALRVLRQKVVKAIQPLCISVLQNDKQSQEELQSSVREIHQRLTENDQILEREAQRLRDDRKRILNALRDAREKFLDARQDEIRDVVFAGKGTRPIEAAKRVKDGTGKDDWIPSPVTLGESLPASHADVVALYQTNARVSAADERELNGLARRRTLLKQISRSAPAWASAIENRHPKHSQPEPPGEPESAWGWRQLYDELERRANVSLEQLQQHVESLGHQLLEVTARLVEKQTWMNQIRQVTPEQRQALGIYALYRDKITKSRKGVLDEHFIQEARKVMQLAKQAVPVWIMPLAEAAETFNPSNTHFDVVIIDEASQCDPAALFALYLGKQVVVVGDKEQVTPTVFQDKTEVLKLINSHLAGTGIPGHLAYDGETSVYELVEPSFGSVIRLSEHFRCAPDIIAFSNSLSYKGEIKPLREASSIPLNPHVVHHRVQGGRERGDNVNEVEAERIAALICAATEQPEYAKNEDGNLHYQGTDMHRRGANMQSQ
jgi:hypothetical protein